MEKSLNKRISGSFRDPSGVLFFENNKLLRSVNNVYKQNYDHLVESGLYKKLVEENLLISHKDVSNNYTNIDNVYKIIEPELVPFISYPYEWSFSQLKDAGLLIIRIQKEALAYKMTLKDASAYNVQFFKGKPILIDTLSFEIYNKNQPWIAYRQFCQHFLAPLSIMEYCDVRFNQLMKIYIDGFPLDFVSKLLPVYTWLKPSILFHIHLHAKAQKKYENQESVPTNQRISSYNLDALIDSLNSAIKSVKWTPKRSEWSEYYMDTNYSREAMIDKIKIIDAFITASKPKSVWDLGANTGLISRTIVNNNIDIIAFDIDHVAVEKNYLQIKRDNETKILPLCIDLNNPSPAIGWANKERLSLLERGPADTIIALALVHHLAISNNVPFNYIADYFSTICKFLIIEFVPKEDSQVQRLLRRRDDIFHDYTIADFESAFAAKFLIKKNQNIIDTHRTVYLMERRNVL